MLTAHDAAGSRPQVSPLSSRDAVEAAITDALMHASYQVLQSGRSDAPGSWRDGDEVIGAAQLIRRLCDDGAVLPLRIAWPAGPRPAPVPDSRPQVVACSALGSLTDSWRQLTSDVETVRALLEVLGIPFAGRAVVSADERRQVTGVFAATADLLRTEVATLTDYGEKPALDVGLHIRGDSGPVRLTVLRLYPGVLDADLSKRFVRAFSATANNLGDRRGWSVPHAEEARATDATIERLEQLLTGPWFLSGQAVGVGCARLRALLDAASGSAYVRVVRSCPQRDSTLVYLAVTSCFERGAAASTRIDVVNAGAPRRV